MIQADRACIFHPAARIIFFQEIEPFLSGSQYHVGYRRPLLKNRNPVIQPIGMNDRMLVSDLLEISPESEIKHLFPRLVLKCIDNRRPGRYFFRESPVGIIAKKVRMETFCHILVLFFILQKQVQQPLVPYVIIFGKTALDGHPGK